MAGPAPTIEVIIRDEVSAALERQRQRLRHIDSQTTFKGVRGAFKGLEDNVTRVGDVVRREMGSLVRLTGATGFLGGGLVAGIAKATQALAGMARASEQTRYLADDLGLTTAQLEKLTARGRALGMSSEQSRSGLTTLAKHMSELKVLGTQASIYKELAHSGGTSGRLFGDRLIASVRGPGGIEAGLREYSRSVGNMNQDAARKATELFGAGSLGFRDLFSKELDGLPHILELPEGAAKRLNVAMAALNISFDNIKKTVGGAVMPAFEQLARGLDQFLQGPGAGIVKMFADWVKSIHIDWAAVARGFGNAINFLKQVFVEVKKAFDAADPIVQSMGGWTNVLAGLAVVIGLGGLAGELFLVARGLKLIGTMGGVITMLAGLVAVATPTTAGAMELPEVSVTPPAPRTRMPQPRPQSAPSGGGGGADGGDIPTNARPTSGGPGGQGYYIPGQQGGVDNDELKRQVRAARVQVASLSSYFSAQAANTDAAGAGGLAGFGGPLKRLGAPMGGAPGGGGGVPGGGGGMRAPRGGGRRRDGGGGGGGGGTPGSVGNMPPPGEPTTQAIIAERAVVMEQLEDSRARSLAAWAIGHEQDHTTGRADVLESLVNRAVVLIRKGEKPEGIVMRLLTGGFYGPINRYRAAHGGALPQGSDWALSDFDTAHAAIAAGRNALGGRNDQGMRHEVGPVGRVNVHGEYFGWHSKSQSGPTAAERSTAAARAGATPDSAPSTAQPAPSVQTTQGGGTVLQSQGTVAATRRGALDPRLQSALQYASDQSGLTVRVTSGGQRMEGAPGATGTHRHDQGRAADFDLVDPKTGEVVPRNDPRRLVFIEAAARVGAGGAGYGYMSDPRKLHMGITGARAIPGQGLGPYAGSPAERDATWRGIQQSRTFDPAALDKEKIAQRKAQSEFDDYLKRQSASQDAPTARPFTSLRSRAGNINLKINVRGPRGVTASADSDGAVSSPVIARSFTERARASRLSRGTFTRAPAESHDPGLDS